MEKGISKSTIGIITIVVVILIAGYFMFSSPAAPSVPSTQSNTQSAASANTAVAEGSVKVSIEDYSYNPAEVKIKAGSNVTWTNNGRYEHTVTSDVVGEGLNSKTITPGYFYTHNFTRAGTYNYHCDFYSNIMKGKVVVVA